METNMDTVPHERLATLGVDTHADIHVAVALDHLGGMLGAIQLLEGESSLGVIDRVGIEGPEAPRNDHCEAPTPSEGV
jgi:hypothetical protein